MSECLPDGGIVALTLTAGQSPQQPEAPAGQGVAAIPGGCPLGGKSAEGDPPAFPGRPDTKVIGDLDIVLSDLHLPGGSGFDLCRRIKADPSKLATRGRGAGPRYSSDCRAAKSTNASEP